jgi:Dolichyl-phosphate-mannose-protein mannosyltransferase
VEAHPRDPAAFEKRSVTSQTHAFLWAGLAIFALTVLLVNPLRETALDDDFAYSLTVRHLLETGHYRTHDWAAPNMPFQAYWGSLVARVLGYSFASLRLSTLALMLLGLIAFYSLAKEHGLDAAQAGLLTLAIFASPLVLRLSFTFNTDIPFLCCLIIALLLWTRAIRLDSYWMMLLGSVASSAAILTRQFGIALLIGLLCVWGFDRDRWRHASLYLVGLTLPTVAAAWQLWYSLSAPSWGMRYESHRLALRFGNPGELLTDLLWRPTVILNYLALFSVPFVLLAVIELVIELRQWHQTRRAITLELTSLGMLSLLIGVGILYGHIVGGHSLLMPYLPWHFGFLLEMGRLELGVRGVVTLLTSVGAVLFARLFMRRYALKKWPSEITPKERLLDFVTLFLLLMHLLYGGFGDTYILVLLPYTLVVVARELQPLLHRFRTVLALTSLVLALTAALWTRGWLEHDEAWWTAAESARATGVEPSEIFGWWVWVFYYSFGDYLVDIGNRTPDSRDDLWHRWLPERYNQAKFIVTERPTAPSGEEWEVVREIPYRTMLFQVKRVRLVKRLSTSYFPVRIERTAARVCEDCLSGILSECTGIR